MDSLVIVSGISFFSDTKNSRRVPEWARHKDYLFLALHLYLLDYIVWNAKVKVDQLKLLYVTTDIFFTCNLLNIS